MSVFIALAIVAAPSQISLEVGGVTRTGLVFAPEKASGAPVVFAFHGHGGSARQASRSFRIHEEWPEAIVVYLQGLTGITGITDPRGERLGWQKEPGQVKDRDILFFDAALKHVKGKYQSKKVFVMGHSNGSRFCHVLWDKRGEHIDGFGFSGGQGGAMIQGNVVRPVFVIAGEKDPLVPFAGQMRSVESMRALLDVDEKTAKKQSFLTRSVGKNGVEFVTYFHPGGHEFPFGAVRPLVEFFKRQAR